MEGPNLQMNGMGRGIWDDDALFEHRVFYQEIMKYMKGGIEGNGVAGTSACPSSCGGQ
jgi:hypothetical protein